MLHILINTLVFVSIGCFSWSSEAETSTPVIMRQFFEELKYLKKYSVSEKKFSDPKNTVEISQHLNSFAKAAKAAGHDPILKHDNFKFSQRVLENHIQETARVFDKGNKNFSRWMLNSTLSVCMSCHSQMPSGNRTFFEFTKQESYFSEFEQAEFLFATHDFDKASALYDKIINRSLKFDDKFEVEKALERQVAYYSRIKRNPKEAIKKFESYKKVQNLTETTLRDIDNWILQFKNWQLDHDIVPKFANEKEILKFARTHLDPKAAKTNNQSYGPDLVTHLYTSGLLYEYLFTHPKSKATPEILYWLAVSDRMINHNFFYSLADLYLKECVIEYPTLPIAKKCYSEYEKEMIFSYSGSAGTNLPGDVKDELESLQRLINTKGIIKLDKK